MKTQIKITGQIGGNYKLLSQLNNGEYSKGMFNSFTIEYPTIREAKKAIREANRAFKYEDNKPHRLSMSKDASTLYYDASKAEIVNLKNI